MKAKSKSRQIIEAFEAGKPIDDAIAKAVREAVEANKRKKPTSRRRKAS